MFNKFTSIGVMILSLAIILSGCGTKETASSNIGTTPVIQQNMVARQARNNTAVLAESNYMIPMQDKNEVCGYDGTRDGISPLSLSQVKYWAYQIQQLNESIAIENLEKSRYDMLVIEPTRTEANAEDFDTKAMVNRLKYSMASDGIHRKLVIAYIDIGEAEDWRWYWNWSRDKWPAGEPKPNGWPSYIITQDPDGWSGNYPVAFWDKSWKDIVIYGKNHGPENNRNFSSIIDETIADGFDGIYLDWVEAYSDDNVRAAAMKDGIDPALEMVKFISEMRNYTRSNNPDFMIIQQNASSLLKEHPELLNYVDGIGQEHIWYKGNADVNWSNPKGYDQKVNFEDTRVVIEELNEFKKNGKPVFNIEYAVNKAREVYDLSAKNGFVAYCSRTALSNLTTTPPPGLNNSTFKKELTESDKFTLWQTPSFFNPSLPKDFSPQKPFPQHTAYTTGTIKPDRFSQKELDDATKAFYETWKKKYLVQGYGEGRYYIFVNADGDATGGGRDKDSISISEGHGYGMIITALMAGSDPRAKEYFDGLYWFFKDHPSKHSPYLMAWNQIKGNQNAKSNHNDGSESATDGDMDIAYALLLADKQWGSEGKINYLQEAKNMIHAIWEKEVNPDTCYLMLGDFVSKSEPQYYYGTRPSDFMMNHLKAYQSITGDKNWQRVIDKTYSLIDSIQRKYSVDTGLLPDFICSADTSPQPAEAYYLETSQDGQYYYNACRVPWRLGTDYLMSGDERAKAALQKINQWIISVTNDNPSNIKDGYSLAGNSVDEGNSIAFVAPLAVSAMIDKSNQDWLNDTWKLIINKSADDEDYYGNTIKMLSMIAASGNWWAP